MKIKDLIYVILESAGGAATFDFQVAIINIIEELLGIPPLEIVSGELKFGEWFRSSGLAELAKLYIEYKTHIHDEGEDKKPDQSELSASHELAARINDKLKDVKKITKSNILDKILLITKKLVPVNSMNN